MIIFMSSAKTAYTRNCVPRTHRPMGTQMQMSRIFRRICPYLSNCLTSPLYMVILISWLSIVACWPFAKEIFRAPLRVQPLKFSVSNLLYKAALIHGHLMVGYISDSDFIFISSFACKKCRSLSFWQLHNQFPAHFYTSPIVDIYGNILAISKSLSCFRAANICSCNVTFMCKNVSTLWTEKRNRAFFVIIWVVVYVLSSNFQQICRNTL